MNWDDNLEEELSKLDEEYKNNEQSLISSSFSSRNSSNSSLKIQNIESLFGITVNNLWKKKSKNQRKGRTGLTSTSKHLPTNITTLLGQANYNYITGNYSQSLQEYQQLIQIVPKLSDSYLSIGIIYEELNNLLASFHYLLLGIKYAIRNCELLYKVATFADDFGYYEKALSLINRISITEKTIKVITIRILLYLKLNYLRKSKKLLNDLFQKYPKEYFFLLQFGECCYENFIYEEGIQSIQLFVTKAIQSFQKICNNNNHGFNNFEEESSLLSSSQQQQQQQDNEYDTNEEDEEEEEDDDEDNDEVEDDQEDDNDEEDEEENKKKRKQKKKNNKIKSLYYKT